MKIRLKKKKIKRVIEKLASQDGNKLEKRLRHRFTLGSIAVYQMFDKDDGFPCAKIKIRIKSKRKRGKHED